MEGLYANTRCVNNGQWEKFELGLGSGFQGYQGQVNSNYVHLDLEWTGSGTWNGLVHKNELKYSPLAGNDKRGWQKGWHKSYTNTTPISDI